MTDRKNVRVVIVCFGAELTSVRRLKTVYKIFTNGNILIERVPEICLMAQRDFDKSDTWQCR